jgi:hypothetical protein
MDLRIEIAAFNSAPPELLETGLIGWLTLDVGGTLRLDSVALRRTQTGKLTLAFPEKVDGRGRRHALVRPLNDEARRRVEAAVFAALGSRAGEEAPL